MTTNEPDDLIARVRLRPGMFVGDTSHFGLSHLAYILLDAAVCDPRRGRTTNLEVRFGADDIVEVSSDAPALSEEEFRADAPWTGGAPFHPTGMEWSIVAALADHFEVTAWGPPKPWGLELRRGEVISRSSRASPPSSWPQGMLLRLKPDRGIFSVGARFDVPHTFDRIRHLAALYPGMRVAIRDDVTGAESVRRFPRGLPDLLSELAPDATYLDDPLVADVTWDRFRVRCAIQWDIIPWAPPRVWSWVNTVPTRHGGAHVGGMAEALRRAILAVAPDVRDGRALRGKVDVDALRADLTAVIAVEGPRESMKFSGPTKDLPSTPGLAEQVCQALEPALRDQIRRTTKTAEWVISRALLYHPLVGVTANPSK